MKQAELFQTGTGRAGANPLLSSLQVFFDQLEASRPLTITEQAKRTMLLQIAGATGAHLASGRLSVADQKALEMVNEVLDGISLAEIEDSEIDALEATMRACTKDALGVGDEPE